jgi:hypothetical protein
MFKYGTDGYCPIDENISQSTAEDVRMHGIWRWWHVKNGIDMVPGSQR